MIKVELFLYWIPVTRKAGEQVDDAKARTGKAAVVQDKLISETWGMIKNRAVTTTAARAGTEKMVEEPLNRLMRASWIERSMTPR